MSDLKNESEQLKEWYVNFLRIFREEYSKLTELEKQSIPRDEDYFSKCQIEVFWLKWPDWQLMVRTHFQDRPDGEVIINGPFYSPTFADEMKKIVADQRWNRVLYPEGNNAPMTKRYNLYSETIADELEKFIATAKNAMFTKSANNLGIITYYTLFNGTRIERFLGNKLHTDYREWITEIIQNTKKRAEHNKTPQQQKTESVSVSEQIEKPKGFGAYFFPPIIIGKIQKPTAVDILEGHRRIEFYTFDKKSFDIKFVQTPVIITKDGYVGVCDKSKENALKILNTIMAISTLDGLNAFAIREHELSQIDYDSDDLNITGYSYNFETVRNLLFQENHGEKILEYPIKEIPQDKIENILQRASEIFKNEKISEELRIFLEATTHLKDSEFSQAFLMSWVIIERHVSDLYNEKTKNQSSLEKSTRYQTADQMLNRLSLEKIISEQEFKTYLELKEKRNEFVHSGKSLTKNEAEKSVNIAKEIVLMKIQHQ